MPTLALDTTTRAGSAALVDGRRVVVEREGDATRSHGERLPGELTRLLAEHETLLSAVDLFAVAAGPGSFTGLRIGIATMQGLAFVGGRPIVALSALDALAQTVAAGLDPGATVGVWMDAQRGEVFSALYRVTAEAAYTPERLAAVEAASVDAPSEVARRWNASVEPEERWLVGDGAVRYHDTAGLAQRGWRLAGTPLLAGTVGLLAGAAAARGQAVAAMAVRPLYVRRPDAILARDRDR